MPPFDTKNVKDELLTRYLAENSVKFNYGSFTDERDGETYKTIQIGNQIWMAENLRYVSVYGKADDEEGSFVYGEVERNLGRFGRLYTWTAAMNLSQSFNDRDVEQSIKKEIEQGEYQGIAPKGWHIPSNEEWETLSQYIISKEDRMPGGVIKATECWEKTFNNAGGDDSVGFAAFPSGGRYSMGHFFGLNTQALYWTSSIQNNEYAIFRSLSNRNKNLAIGYTYKSDAYAIRCVKNAG